MTALWAGKEEGGRGGYKFLTTVISYNPAKACPLLNTPQVSVKIIKIYIFYRYCLTKYYPMLAYILSNIG